jgi:hypothetical protein
MMSPCGAICHKDRINKDWGDAGEIGEVGTTRKGVVEEDDIAINEWPTMGDGGFDAPGHGAEVDGDMGSLSNKCAVRIKQGARVIAALLDVGRKGTPFERGTHFFGNRGTAMAKNFQ